MYRAPVLNATLGVEGEILTDEPQRVDRLPSTPKLERDFGPRLRSDAERRAGHKLLADGDIGAGEHGYEAGPAIRMLDDYDASVTPIRAGEGDAAGSRSDDLSAGPRNERQTAARTRRLRGAESGHGTSGDRQDIRRGRRRSGRFGRRRDDPSHSARFFRAHRK